MLRWGIVGVSTVAAAAVAPALRDAGHDLAVVGSRSRGRAQEFAANQGARRARGSYDEVLASDDVDCVYVALPNALHEEWAVKALEAGKHVLCAKPLSTSLDGVRRMAAAAAAGGCVLMEARSARVHPRTEALLETIREGELGAVRALTGIFGRACRDASDIRLDPVLGGGALLDSGGDLLAMSRWLVGVQPDQVQAVARRAAGVDMATAISARYPSGATASLHAAIDTAAFDELVVAGTRGTVRLPQAFAPPPGQPAVLVRHDGTTASFPGDGFSRMVEHFAAAVIEGRPTPLAVDDAVATAETLDRVRAAST